MTAMQYTMKDSGVPWIGAVPEHWAVCKLKFLCSMQAGKNLTAEDIQETGLYPVYGGNGLRGYYSEYNHKSESLLVGRQGALCGNVHRVHGKYWATEHAVVTQPLAIVEIDFLYYLLIGMNLNQYASDAAAQPGLSVGIIRNIPVVLLPKNEQISIAAYLDRKCSAIDGIIAEAKATIEEYKAWKASVIFEAVTKGLDPHAGMKDSGVEWIGMVPKEWKKNKLKYCACFMPSCDFSQLSADTSVTFTPMECIKRGTFENRQAPLRNLNSSYTQYQDGDIVFAKVTPCFENGNIAIMEGLHSGFGFGSSELFVVRPYKINTKYLFYSLQTNSFIDVGKASMTGTGGLKRVSSNAVMNYQMFLPPLPEQEAIAAYLDEKCSAIDGIIAEKQSLIDDLEAYKKSLIFETVTGKRRVC